MDVPFRNRAPRALFSARLGVMSFCGLGGRENAKSGKIADSKSGHSPGGETKNVQVDRDQFPLMSPTPDRSQHTVRCPSQPFDTLQSLGSV